MKLNGVCTLPRQRSPGRGRRPTISRFSSKYVENSGQCSAVLPVSARVSHDYLTSNSFLFSVLHNNCSAASAGFDARNYRTALSDFVRFRMKRVRSSGGAPFPIPGNANGIVRHLCMNTGFSKIVEVTMPLMCC